MTVPIAGRGGQVFAIYTVFVVLGTLAVSARTYCRLAVVKNFGWDDGLALGAQLFFILHASFALSGVHHGTGQHAWDIIPASNIPTGLMFWWLCEPVYVISNMMIKASIAIMLLRITIYQVHRAIIYAVLVITQIYSAAFFFVFIFQCTPPSDFWTQLTGGTGRCADVHFVLIFVYVYSVITCIGDWVFAILPWFLVRDMTMNKSQKGLVIIILGMGAVFLTLHTSASAATIARLPYVHTLADKSDFLYATVDVAIFSCLETGLGIFSACCSTLKPLFRSCLDSKYSAYDMQSRSLEVLDNGVRETTPSPDMERHRGEGKRLGSASTSIVAEEGISEAETMKWRTPPLPRLNM